MQGINKNPSLLKLMLCIFWVFLVSNLLSVVNASVGYDHKAIIINGQRRILISGSIHYPRSTPEMWPDLIQKAKEGGLDVIQTYVFWNGHEPEQGKYYFEDRYDLVKFIKLIHQAGLYAHLRIGPYVCAEWNFGGFPVWLKYVPGINFRTDNGPFKAEMQRFTEKIVNMMKAERLFETQGGPIIMSQIENEYGPMENELGAPGRAYTDWAAKMALGLTTEVPWVMCKQDDAPDPIINTCNGFYCDYFTPNKAYKPKMWTEAWTGWYTEFGGPVPKRPAEDLAFAVARFIQKGGSFVNYYMYHGGTNFGRTAGGPFIATSYDYDAPLDEFGLLQQPKWDHLKDLHRAIKLCEPALVSSDPTVIRLGSSQEAHEFKSKSGACAAFLANYNAKSYAKVAYGNNHYNLPPWSISILPDCKNTVFNTARIGAQSAQMKFTPVYQHFSWQSYNDETASTDDSAFTMIGLVEQVNTTRDMTDYLWYMTDVKIGHNEGFLKGGKSPILTVMSAGHALHVYINGQLAGTAYGSLENPKITFSEGVNLSQNLTSASSALQGLLRKLGAGLDDLLPSSAMGSASSSSHQSGRLKKILSGLRADGEDGKQVEALTQLCELLSIGTEDSLSTFSVDSFIPVLVGLLNHESNPDIMLLAARAITHLVDVLPSSCAAVVHYGAVNCFCARLLTIEYMDLAEQSLQALKKISQEHPTACLRAGALMAVLSYLDFFSTGVQRVALATAANMCKKLPSDAADFVMEAVPHLTNLLQYHDAKVLEHASVCLTRIVEAFASSSDKLDELCNHGLVTQAASLISTSNSGGGQASLSTSTYTGLIRLLATCASGSTVGAKTLLLLGISGILKDILAGSGLVGNMSVSPALSRPPEQIFEIVNLANELLPPLPQGTISLPASSNLFVRRPLFKKSPMSSSGKQDETNGNVQDVSAREKLMNDQPELLQQFGIDLLPVLIQIHGSSVNGPVRHKCLSVIGKLMFFSSAEMISSLNSTTNISSFLSGVLAWKDPQVLVPALQIAEILMEKLPETFSKMFVREGVVHAVDSLIASPSNSISAQTATPEKDSESALGTSARARRLRRRSGNQQQDANSLEELRNSVSVNVGSPPTSVEIPTASSNLRTTVSGCAKSFKDKFFPSDLGTVDVGISEDLLHLKNLCAKLNASVEEQKSKVKGKSKTASAYVADFVTGKEESLVGIVYEMLAELSKGDGVSTFEFIGSGVVAALLNYFSCGYFNKEKISEVNLPKLRQQALKRYKLFISIALPSSSSGGNDTPMTVLVQKLQNALSSLERFPVVLSHSARSSGGSARLSSGLSALSQPFKLRLCRAPGEKSLRDYSNTVVLIDPLASLAAVEDFLWPRVQRSESGQKASTSVGNSDSGPSPTGAGASSPAASTPAASTRRQSSRSRSGINIGDYSKKDTSQDKTTSSSKGKGKAILKPSPEESKGPQTRNAARRRAASDKDAQIKSPTGESSSEDEDLELSPVDIDDALVIEDDDISDDDDDDDQDDVLRDDSLPACMADKVHDVKLSDSAEDGAAAPATSDSQNNPASGSSSRAATVRGSDSTDFRSGSSFGSRGAMSFAAAAMAGLASNGRGIRGGRDRHGRPLGGSSDPPKLVFSAGGKQLNLNLTIYQAIQRQLVTDEEDDERYNGSDLVTSDGSRLWSDIYTITYQRADSQVEKPHGAVNSASPSKSTKSGAASASNAVAASHRSPLDSILQGELPCDMEKNNPTYNVLSLLRVLEGLNQLAPRLRVQTASDKFSEGMISDLNELTVAGARVLTSEFVNSKLTPKLARQIQDALALCSGSLPSWCYQLTKACPFLFPFETRRQFFYSTAFGLSRALYRLQQQQGEGQGSSEREVRVGRLQRQKVRVSRNRILDSAAKVMEMYSSQKAVLEVEYFGEVGTGLGPTLEFYTLLSHDLQKVDLKMWRTSSFDKSSMEIDSDNQSKDGKSEDASGLNYGENANLVQSPLGLFPRPWPPSADASESSHFSKVVEHFRLLGRIMAKALQDGRLLDLPLSTAFYKLVLGQELDLHDILSFDPEVGKTLRELQALVCRKQYLESIGGDHPDVIAELCFRGTPIEDLCLDFTLPGYPDYVLKPGDENVDINNLEEYISLVVDATVKSGIIRQLEAFRAGFNQVFDVTSLQIFSPDELDCLLCGRRELWKPDMLVDHIKFDHGYTAKSPAIVYLLEIMGEFTPEQQRAFCQFVTGAPRLPPGGLAVLSPKLTIVRKHSSTTTTASNGTGPSETADDDLPSVMTCANYLKLPPYSTKEIMFKKLLYAINEGQGSFDLS